MIIYFLPVLPIGQQIIIASQQPVSPVSAASLDAVDVPLHPVRALALHLVGDMAVDIQREGRRGMAEIALHRLDVVPGPDGSHGVGMA